MTNDAAAVDKSTGEIVDDFALEPSEPGIVPPRVIDELRHCYREAKDYTGALADAIKAQAETHGVEAAALRKYIAALEQDDVEDTRKEIDDLRRLIEEGAA
jgi:phytoene/squalene synthetase